MSMKVRALCVATVLAATLSLAGCGHYTCGATFGSSSCSGGGGGIGGGGGGGLSQTVLVYFMVDGAGQTQTGQMALEALNLNNNQIYDGIGGFVSPDFTGAGGSDGGVVVVGKKYLYVPFSNGAVFSFAINSSSGALTPITGTGGTSPFTSASGGTSVVAHPSGSFLYVGGSGGVSAFTVNQDGSLTPIGSPYSTGGVTPFQMSIDGAGKYLYALDGASLSVFGIQSNGSLALVSGSPFPFSMMQIEPDKSGAFMVGITGQTAANSGVGDPTVYVFSVGSTGVLTQTNKITTVNPPAFMQVDAGGSFVYTFNQTDFGATAPSQPMEGFSLSSGTLTALPATSFSQLDAAMGKIDQAGLYIFAAAQIPSTDIGGTFVYGINNDGSLSNTIGHAGTPSASYAVTDEP